jgi:hypothetical protein
MANVKVLLPDGAIVDLAVAVSKRRPWWLAFRDLDGVRQSFEALDLFAALSMWPGISWASSFLGLRPIHSKIKTATMEFANVVSKALLAFLDDEGNQELENGREGDDRGKEVRSRGRNDEALPG